MAGYSVTVCLPAEASADLATALSEALAPFGATSDRDWDQGFLWDSWRVAGGADGFGFWIMPGGEDDPRLIHDGPRWDRPSGPSLPGRCAGGPRALLDLRPDPALGRLLAEQTWDLWHDLARDLPPALPFGMILADLRHQRDSPNWYDAEVIRAAFEVQPLIQAFRVAHPVGGRDPARFSSDFLFWPEGLIGSAGRDKETFVKAEVRQLTGGADLLTLDGWWIETDGTANHGSCGSGCDHTPVEYNQARGNSNIHTGMIRYLQTRPADTLLVEVRGHC